MFSEILKRFIKDSPVAVMVRALLENLLNADKIDRWFEGVRQTRYWFSLIVLQAFDFKLDRRDEPHLNSQDLPPGKTFFQNTQSHGGDLLSGKVISVNKSTHHTGRIRMSHLGKSGLRSNRVSISCIAFLDSEMPFS